MVIVMITAVQIAAISLFRMVFMVFSFLYRIRHFICMN